MGPTPILAASFIIFGLLVDRLGHVYSRLPPKRCKSTLRALPTVKAQSQSFRCLDICYLCKSIVTAFLD